jgi:hypothetical protein
LSEFIPAPSVLDNNFLACSRAHIEEAVERLAAMPVVDFLHGLDARLLRPWHIELFRGRLNMPCWRFTFDSLRHESTMREVINMLASFGIEAEDSVVIYCLCGYDDSRDDAYSRRDVVLSLGAHPYAMRHQPLDALRKNAFVPDGWTAAELKEFRDICNIPTTAWILRALARAARS